MMHFILFVFLLLLAACSDPAPVSPPLAGKEINEAQPMIWSLVFSPLAGKEINEARPMISHPAGKATDDDCPLCDFFDAFNELAKEKEKGADLIVQSPSVSAVLLTPGQAFTLHVTVHNQGDEQAAATMLHYYRSNNATITASDTEVGTGSVDTLASSATSAQSIALIAPTSVGEGIYFYGACVESVSGESNTGNNCSSAVEITVSGQEAMADEEDTPESSDTTAKSEPQADSVVFEDPNLEAVVRQQLARPQGRLTPEDVASLNELEALDKNIQSLVGLEHFTALEFLSLMGNQIADVGPLANLTNLQILQLNENQIVDIGPLTNLTNLFHLVLDNNQIADVTPLANMTNLSALGIGGNQIVDVGPLAKLTNLQALWLWKNQIADVGPLANLTNLQELQLGGNQVADVEPLANLTNLQRITLWKNQIVDVGPLAKLTNLQWLLIGGNQIVDVGPLANLTNLQWLALIDNQIADVGPLAKLTNLQTLQIWNNPLSNQARNEQIPALRARGVDVFD